jgi:hypothetical protein
MSFGTIRAVRRLRYPEIDSSWGEVMGSLETFIHYENLILFKKQLADPRTSAEQRKLLLRLSANEEAKEFSDEKGRADSRRASVRTTANPDTSLTQ